MMSQEFGAALEETLPEDTAHDDAWNLVDLVAGALRDAEDAEPILEAVDGLAGRGRAEVPALGGRGQADFRGMVANGLQARYTRTETPSYDERDEVSLRSRLAFEDPLFEVFQAERPGSDFDHAHDAFKYFNGGWQETDERSAALLELAYRRTGNDTAVRDLDWWGDREVTEEEVTAVSEYSRFQQDYLRETFAPEDDTFIGFRAFKGENVLEEDRLVEDEGPVHIAAAPLEHWSFSPVDAGHYARDDSGDDHGYICMKPIPVDDIAGANVASNAFAGNVAEMYVFRDGDSAFTASQVIPYEEADMVGLAMKGAAQVADLPENIADNYNL